MANQATPTGENRPKTPVSLATLEKRLRRRLAVDCLQLRKNRPGTYQFQEHGQWSVVDPRAHTLRQRRFTLEGLARDLGVLAAHEIVADGQGVTHA